MDEKKKALQTKEECLIYSAATVKIVQRYLTILDLEQHQLKKKQFMVAMSHNAPTTPIQGFFPSQMQVSRPPAPQTEFI